MKTITFFSEKGGVGKSSFSIMYASWLSKHGIDVALADFNHRISRYRESEIRARNKFIEENPEAGVLPFDEKKAWPIINAWASDIQPYKEDGLPYPYGSWFNDQVTKGKLAGHDVIVCDFPGSMADGSFMHMLYMRQLGLIVIPTEKDEMTLGSTLRLKDLLNKTNNYCCFINKAQLGLKNFRTSYLKLGRKLTAGSVRMLPDIVTYSERMTTIDKVDIIRSTFGFPDFSKPEYSGLSDLGIENLFIDVTRELAKAPDFKGTEKADLTFIETMEKKNDGRFFKGSAFPEYEL